MNTFSFPGLIDCHVHFRDPGFPNKATMQSEAESAIAGGVWTVCDMPNTNPPTVTYDAFQKKAALTEKAPIDIRLFFGITKEEHMDELRAVCADEVLVQKLCGVKLYLDHSTGNQKVDGGIVEEIFALCAELHLTLVAHCEDAEINAAAEKHIVSQVVDGELPDVSLHSLCRPVASEVQAIAYAVHLAERHGTRFHVAHLTTAEGVDMIRKAKAKGVEVTCEVAPHHLFLSLEDYKHLGTFAKMNPPLRSQDEQKALWDGIADGTVDCIATDHAPHTMQEKQEGEPLNAPSGVPGVETLLPLLLTVAAGSWPNPKTIPPTLPLLEYADIQRLCFENPNRIFALGKTPEEKTIIVNPAAEWKIHAQELHSKCTWTPYEGWSVIGRICSNK